MTSKRVKAWAVVDADGELKVPPVNYYCVAPTKLAAQKIFMLLEGERVVPVTIVLEEK